MLGGDVGAFRTARAHGALHDPGDDLDDLLHETDVIHDGEEGADEDDGGEYGEGEDGEGVAGDSEVAEDQLRSRRRSGRGVRGDVGCVPEDGLAVGPLDATPKAKTILRPRPQATVRHLMASAVGGECVGEGEEGDESEKSGVTSQGVLRREIGFECYGECTGESWAPGCQGGSGGFVAVVDMLPLPPCFQQNLQTKYFRFDLGVLRGRVKCDDFRRDAGSCFQVDCLG